MNPNLDTKTVEGFGQEWTRFDQTRMSDSEFEEVFEKYFRIFPWSELLPDAEGFDLGCGSGRWAKIASQRVGKLHCIDASADALAVAKKNLAGNMNVEFHNASVHSIPLKDGSMDFGYSLGVLHHVPDTEQGIGACVTKLKPGAPFLVYLYYAFDNRPAWFRAAWKISDILRKTIAGLPFAVKKTVTDLIALFVYFPLALISRILERFGFRVESIPLSTYRRHSFYTMRTDSLDRFGTKLEKRFTRQQIAQMMRDAGFEEIVFSEHAPYWCACGLRSGT